MNNPKKKIITKRGFIAALHAIFLLFLAQLLLNWRFVHWDEGEILQFGPILKKLVLNWEVKPPQEELLFIDVSEDFQLLDVYDDYGFPSGNTPATDRKKLADLFQKLSNINNHKYLLADLRFDLPSDQDSLLQHSINGLNRVVFSGHINENKWDTSVVKVPRALSDYPIVGGGFFKFKYIQYDSVKTTPLVMWEDMGGGDFNLVNGYLNNGDGVYFNTFMPELLVRPYDIFDAEKNYFYEKLGVLTDFFDEESLAEITRDKIIVISDLKNRDIHETLLGDMPGSLILINAYYTLKRGINRVSIPFVLFIYLGFLIISMIIFIPGDPVEKALVRLTGNNRIAQTAAGILSYFFLLILIVLLSYLFFGVLLNVLWLTFYLFIVNKLVEYWDNKRLPNKEEV